MPRKKSEDFYRLHGFTANFERGKYTAICNICDKVLQNTALTRLSLHRQNCTEQNSKDPLPYRITEVKKDLKDRHRIKIQEISSEDDGLGCDTEGKEIIVKIHQILDAGDDGKADKTRTPVLVKSETRKSANPGQGPEQHMEFEISSADFVDDSKEEELEDSTIFVEARPRNLLAVLKAKKTRAEIRQYQSKTKFLKTETENMKVERTLTLLRIQKLRLEIDALSA